MSTSLGYNALTVADIQALLWFPEKRLYEAGAAKEEIPREYATDEVPDYANAAIDLAKAQGIADADIAKATRGATSAPRRTVTGAAAARRARTVQSRRRAAARLKLAQPRPRAQRRGAYHQARQARTNCDKSDRQR
jgi:hypothetical protein